jgi:prepilin-type N-terminal cleavage/methylation domain-containing protein
MTRIRRSSRGFTLVELVVVMALLLAVTAVAAPRFSDFFPSLKVRKSADRLFAWARKARADAAESGATQRLVIQTERKAFWIEREARPLKEPGRFTPLGGAWIEETLPEDVEIDLLEGLEEDPSGAKRRWVEFRPDGTATEARIGLSHATGERRIIDVAPANARIRILTEEEAAR